MDEPLSELQPAPSGLLRAAALLARIWARVVSPAGARLATPAVAAVLVYVLWRVWRIAGRTALGRAVRWHLVFLLAAATAGLAMFLLAAPPEDPSDAAAARAVATDTLGRPVYTAPLAVAGAAAVAITTFAALRSAWRWRVPVHDHTRTEVEWHRWRGREGRLIGGVGVVIAGGALSVCAAAVAVGSLASGSVHGATPLEGALWVATPHGAARLTQAGWETLRRPWTPLPSSIVNDVATGPNGEVWLATDGGLLRVGADGSLVRAVVENAPLPYPTVLGVAVDRRGVAWAATVAGAAAVDVNKSGRAYSGRTAPLMHQLLDAAMVDRSGRVWFGGAGGVNVYEPPVDLSEPGRWPAGFNRWLTGGGLPDNLVFAIFEDSKGRVWFGTGGGVAAFTPDAGAFALGSDVRAHWTTFTSATSPLVQDKVHAITEDAAGRIYFGTERGVSIYEEGAAGTGRWSVIEAVRLPHPFVEAFATSPDGRVWLGTKRGLAVYDSRRPSAELHVYRAHPIRRWTGIFWPPHARMDLLADEINALAWVP